MSPLAIAATAASAVVAASASMAQAKAAKQTGEYNKKIFDHRAKLFEQDKLLIDTQKDQDLLNFNRQYDQLQASTVVGYLKNGVVIDEGTPMQVLKSNAERAEFERNTIEYNAELGKRNAVESANIERMRGDVALMTGQSQAFAARTQAVSSLLGGAASTYGAYNRYYG
jgi:hypothetical protein|tara:strand:- start:44 stop:550 length:507 start_codon:yes stop_codon:yes gene_type:complete